jgi:hypothetical protein
MRALLSDRADAEDRHWAENRIVEFFTIIRGRGGESGREAD